MPLQIAVRRASGRCRYGVDLGDTYTEEQTEFLKAIDRAKRAKGKGCLTYPEVLALAKALGYRLAAPAAQPVRAAPRRR
jgi:hypothetical protein